MEKQQLNPTLTYVLSVLGFLCCCFAGLGFIPAGIAFFIANSKLNEAKANPENYDGIKGMNTAKIVAIIVFAINILYLARTIYMISTIGWDEFNEEFMRAMEQYQQN
jgi:energy-converting hydrogenase Eha subunit G